MKGLLLGIALASVSFVASSHANAVSRLLGGEQGVERNVGHGHGPAAPTPTPVCNALCINTAPPGGCCPPRP